jgi:NAD-dependent deacetylase sirtuin 4
MASAAAASLQFVPRAALTRAAAGDVARLVAFLGGGGGACVISGAGLSTESGIPDYRSENGSYSKGHKPLTHQDFMSSAELRKRYWARAVVAAKHFVQAAPNRGHLALATLERRGVVSSVVTQNVDRLHVRAGSVNLLELHGHTDGVQCVACGHESSRGAFHERVRRGNEAWFEEHWPPGLADVRADGDAQVDTASLERFVVPGCALCGHAVLKPTIVFFGGNVPEAVREHSFQLVRQSARVLVVGTSLATWSSFRLCKAAHEAGLPLAVLNAGPTRADNLCSLKLDQASCAALLHAATEQLGGGDDAKHGGT